MDRIVPLYAHLARRQREEQCSLAMQALARVLQHTQGEVALEPVEALGRVLEALRSVRRRRAPLRTGAAWRTPLTVGR